MSDTNNTINNIPTFTPEEAAAGIEPCPPMFTVGDEGGRIQPPTLTPTEVFEHIKYFLGRLLAKREGGNIRLSYRDSKTGAFKAWIQVSREMGGLAVSVAAAQNRSRRICNLEQLDAFLFENIYDPIDELESLIGHNPR